MTDTIIGGVIIFVICFAVYKVIRTRKASTGSGSGSRPVNKQK